MPRVVLYLLCLVGLGCERSGDVVVVFAAASVAGVIEQAADRFEADTGRSVEVHSAASSMLARQIDRGARVDVVILANTEWMDRLSERGLIADRTRRDLLSNRLVVVAPTGSGRTVELSGEPGQLGLRVALADPGHVPAGMYATEALRALGWWNEVERRVVPGIDARATLRYVELGEVDTGIVYASDAMLSDRVEIAAELPEHLHTPIVYPSVLTPDAVDGAELFLIFLRTPAARAMFDEAGFGAAP